MNDDVRFMRIAIEKAREGMENGQTPFGAVIVREGEVIASVHNVVWRTTDITAHAEVNAIRHACRALGSIDLSGCTIYSSCEPCPMCFSACHWAKLDRIVFGARIEDAERGGFSELTISNEKMKEMGGSPIEIVADFMRDENRAVFDEWCNLQQRPVY